MRGKIPEELKMKKKVAISQPIAQLKQDTLFKDGLNTVNVFVSYTAISWICDMHGYMMLSMSRMPEDEADLNEMVERVRIDHNRGKKDNWLIRLISYQRMN
jgi:hypothetical protein